MSHAPWLLEAPPWGPELATLLPAEGTPAQTRKRTAEKMSLSEAEIELGKLAQATDRIIAEHGWRRTVEDVRGVSNIARSVRHVPHKAARLLEHLRVRGAAVPTATAPWDQRRRDEAITRGPHQSSHVERQFVCEEMLDFCQQGYWIVVPYATVAHWPSLRISPLGVVPQRDRRPRLIVDYTFSGVNDDTVSMSPREAMQFGRALQRMFTKMVHADPRYGPVHMAKIDIADGFYRVWLQIEDVLKLGVALPTAPNQPPLVAFPLALPMGWVESPPYFTTLTETVCDLANELLTAPVAPRLRDPHRLEAVAATPPPALEAPPSNPAATSCAPAGGYPSQQRRPLAAVDVYVDDFLLLAQTRHQQRRVMRAALHSIDDVFRPLEDGDPSHPKEPASVKKMLKGDACWSPRKRMLGWDIDANDLTLNLPPHRLERLREVLQWISPPQKRLSTRKWHQLLGELRSMSPALPGTRGLFSVLQEALSNGDNRRVRLNQRVYDTAADFASLVDSLATRPTRLQELVPTTPSYIGACDACQVGMGGVWFDREGQHPPLVWRQPFASHVAKSLVTAAHRAGTISISDLELAGIIAHKDVLSSERDVRERTIWLASDNRAAVSWSTKGSATSLAARAYLLQYNALHQRHFRYLARHHYIPGPVNAMADDASRRWDLSDADLLTHFNSVYPQATSWTLFPLRPATNSSLTGALCRKRPTGASLANAVPLPSQVGATGSRSALACSSTPGNWAPVTPCPFSSSLHSVIEPDRLHPAVDLSALGQWRTPYELWARRTPGWGPRTLV